MARGEIINTGGLGGMLDAALDVIEPELRSLAAAHELPHFTIERWRQNEPAISLSWRSASAPEIGRNILVHLLRRSARDILVAEIEVNGSQDDRGMRRWQHVVISPDVRICLDDSNPHLQPLLDEAYRLVSGWTQRNLQRTYPLGLPS